MTGTATTPAGRRTTTVRRPAGSRASTLAYVAQRIGQALLTMLLVYVFVFFVVTALPGDPISNRINDPDAGYTPAVVDALKAWYGLDQPLWERFLRGLGGLVTGDLGLSLRDAKPVSLKLEEAFLPTLQLAGAALVVTVVVAVAGALLTIYGRWKPLRTIGATAPSIVNALPVYLVALIIVHIFSFQLRWFPLVGTTGPTSLVLPALVLGITISPSVAQVLVTSLQETEREPFVTVARSRGTRESRVFFRHLIPATATTNLTVLGLIVSALLGGAVVTETVFSRPGLGKTLNEAVLQHDLPVLQALVLIVAATYLTINLIVDLLYPVLDPRILLGGRR